MPDTSDIEKKSLEAHVELCAERYRFIEQKLEALEDNTKSLKSAIDDVHAIVQKFAEKRNNQLISWGLGMIVFLSGGIGWLITHYVLK